MFYNFIQIKKEDKKLKIFNYSIYVYTNNVSSELYK